MKHLKLFPLTLLGLCLWSCKEKSAPAVVSGITEEGRSAVTENAEVHFSRYYESYQGNFAESVRRMASAENNQEFMKQYREFSEKNPNFWEISGNLRLVLVGLKGRIDEEKPLSVLEKGAAGDLVELLMKAKNLPSSEPYQNAKAHIAAAYADFDITQQPKVIDNTLNEAIAKLPLAAKRETEVSK